MSSSAASAGRPLLFDTDRSSLRQRWIELEERFVDDPAGTVRRADELLDDVIDRIRTALEERRSMLRDRLEALDDATTEQLRAAFHEYEQLHAQLTDVQAPAGWHDAQAEEQGGRPTTHGAPSFRSGARTAHDGETGEQEHH